MLELIQFEPNSGEAIRAGAKAYDLGMFDVAVRAKNIDEVYDDLKQQGFEFISPPVVYTADWANVKVKEVIIIGPDQMPVAFIERLSEPIPVIKGRFGTMVDSAQIVKNIDNVSPFYTDILGYTSVFDKDLPDGLIDEVLDLPQGTHSRMAFLLQLETNTPAIELIHCSAPGSDLSDRIKPTNPGLFSLAFQTDDLDALTGKIQSAGYRIIAGPIEMETGIHGKIKTVIVEGPNRALLEFFENEATLADTSDGVYERNLPKRIFLVL